MWRLCCIMIFMFLDVHTAEEATTTQWSHQCQHPEPDWPQERLFHADAALPHGQPGAPATTAVGALCIEFAQRQGEMKRVDDPRRLHPVLHSGGPEPKRT